ARLLPLDRAAPRPHPAPHQPSRTRTHWTPAHGTRTHWIRAHGGRADGAGERGTPAVDGVRQSGSRAEEAYFELRRSVVADWSDSAVCQAWRRSYTRRERADDALSTTTIAQVRQLYLDELEKRHPAEFDAW